MALAKMTLIGLINYYDNVDQSEDTLFDNLNLPEGIDKNTVINNIIGPAIFYDVYENNVEEFILTNCVPLLAELPFNNGVSRLNNEDSIEDKDTQLIKDWINPVVDYLFKE